MTPAKPWTESLVAGALAFAAGIAVCLFLPVSVHNDVAPTLVWHLARPDWITLAGMNPLEHFWAFLAVRLAPDPYGAWPFIGAVHLGLFAALLHRLVRLVSGESPGARMLAWAAAGAALLQGSILHYFLSLNSVTFLAVASLLWLLAVLDGRVWAVRGAVALVALSRADGGALAGLLVLEPLLTREWRRRLPEAFVQAGIVAAAGLVWLAIDYSMTGRVFGIAGNIRAHEAAIPQAVYSAAGIIRWLRGAWMELLSEGTLLLAATGALALYGRRHPALKPLAFIVIAHHGILAALGMSGKVLSHRYFTPDLGLALVLAAAGIDWISGLLTGVPRRLAAAVLLAVWIPGIAGSLAEFRDYLEENRRIEAAAPAIAECLVPEIRKLPEPPLLVVPGELRAVLIYRLKAERLHAVDFEKLFLARSETPAPPVLWLRPKGEPEIPPLMHGRSYTSAACGEAGTLFIFPFARRG